MNTKIIALASALGALTMGGAADAGDAANASTTKISFDGFCDGMSITVFSWHQAGTKATGCLSNIGAGMEGKVLGAKWKGKTLTIGENPNVSGEIVLYNIQYPLTSGGGWSSFETTDGVNFTPLQSGTYTINAPGERLPSVGPASNSLAPK